MKLILASDLSFLLKYGYDLTGIPKNQMRVGYVTTASKGTPNPDYIKKIGNIIKENGIYFEEIDIEGKSESELKEFFEDKNIIHIEGGSTFYLLKVICETGFGKILKEQLEKGKIYIGTSAGAYIMCPSIEVSSWNEDQNFFGIQNFTALNYVPFVLKAHYKDDENEFVKNKLKTLKYPIHILKDGQGMFCNNGICEFVGDEKEVRI